MTELFIAPQYLEQLCLIIKELYPQAVVWAYGSRTDGSAHEASDLDLVVDFGQADGDINKLRDALRESNIPFPIDIFEYEKLPKSFQEEIAKNHVVICDGNKLISVIIPVYNVEKYLERGLVTVLNQTHKNLEIIIVDDGSTDNSAKIYTKYADKDKRVKIIFQENSGVASARNAGLCIARGEYIHFMDADDLIPFDFYEKMLCSIIHADTDMACSGAFWEIAPQESFKFQEETIITELSEKLTIAHRVSAVWVYLFKKSFIDKYNLQFDEELNKFSWGEDTIFSIMARYYASAIVKVPNVLYFYKTNPNSISNAEGELKAKLREENIKYVKAKLSQFAQEHNFAHLLGVNLDRQY